jgi:excinuclease ABC subunit B
VQYMSKEQLEKAIVKSRKAMEAAVKELDFVEAARLRDEMFSMQKLLAERE